MFEFCVLPAKMSKSLIIPLVKSFKKSLSDPNNYRGICLTPVVTKILESIILIKCSNIKDSFSSQYGFKNKSSTLHAEYVINETIKSYNSKGSTVYICSLDAEKAFDSCNWSSLFNKLTSDTHLPSSAINIIYKLYINGTASVSYLDQISSEFKLTQGVHQGSILSPYLYNIYTNQLLLKIESLNVGTTIGGEGTSITAYADDIILMSSTLSGLQKLIDTCVEYGKSHSIKFNYKKTEFIISGKSHLTNHQIKIDSNIIYPKSSLVHLGFHWKLSRNRCVDLQSSHSSHRIQEAWASVNALISSGIRFCHPNTIKSIFLSQVIPNLTYGLELCKLSDSFISSLERHANMMIKCLFNVSKFSRNLLFDAVNIPYIKYTLYRNKIAAFIRLLNNMTTKKLSI